MINALGENGRFDIDLVSEYIRFDVLLGFVELENSFGQVVGAFTVAALEVVWLAVFTFGILFVAMFDEDNFAELAKGGNRTTTPAFPKRLMTFTNCGAKFFSRHGDKVFAENIF
jgi:hypothetical protein